MKIIYSIVIFCPLLLLSGCNKEYSPNVIEINLGVKPEKENVYKYSDFFDSISFYKIPVEEVLLGDMIKKIVKSDELTFVLDHRIAKAVVCIDKDGKIRYVINKIGKGPGEFVKIWNISVCNGILYVYDKTQKKIIQFNALSGKFIREEKIPFMFRDFVVTDNYTYYLTYPNKKVSHWLYIVNNKTSQIKKELSYKEFPNFNIPERISPFFKLEDNEVILCHSYIETIFKISDDVVMPYIKLNTGSKSLFNHINELEKANKKGRIEIEQKCISSFGDYYENNDFIWFNFRKANTVAILIHVLINKNNGEVKVMNNFKNDITNKYSQLFKASGNNAVSILDIGTLFRIKEMEKDEFRIINDNKEIFKNLDINDNPLIIEYHAKE
ncbi:6-bladed beta-propeller [Saccharicrinis sp. FJH2]|uniref:6-bladed beta-propeller n=1 Tax=Saccharicrinis sp. FJH65 TaxID=3344659 RepID=UPI0035F47EFD